MVVVDLRVVAVAVGVVVDDSPVVEDVDVGAGAVLEEVIVEIESVVECEEPPHPPINSKTGTRPARIARRLTFSA